MAVGAAVAEDVRQLPGRRRLFHRHRALNRVIDCYIATVTASMSAPDGVAIDDVFVAPTYIEVWRCVIETTNMDAGKFDTDSGSRSGVTLAAANADVVQIGR